MKTGILLPQLFLIMVLAGCASQATPLMVKETPRSMPEPTLKPKGESTLMNMPPTSYPSKLEELTEIAKQDLARRLSIPLGEVSLVEARQVVWSDSSLGCPLPDMMYAQVLTPGYLIKLEYADREYEYHAGQNGVLAYCESPQPPAQDNT